MTKILRIIARLNVGGPAIHVTNLNYYLDKNYGYESLLVYGSLAAGEGSMEYLAADKNLRTLVLPELGREISFCKDLKTIWRLYRIIRREKPDIVHTHTAKAGTVGRLAARLAGVKKIYHTFHGHIFHSYFGRLKSRVFMLIEKLLAPGTTRIIAVSDKQKAELVNYGIAKPEKITVIRLGFELEKFQNLPENKRWHKKYGLPPDTILVGIVGRLTPVKNFEYFLEIAAAVCAKTDNIRFIIIGDGELRRQLECSAELKGLKDRVFLPGFLREPEKIYGDLDIVVLTSRNEGTPVTLIEAMACAKPVVSTEVGGVPDIVKNNISGYLCPQNQPEVFADRIIELSRNAALRRSLGKAAQSKILKLYAVTRLAEDMHNLYKL
ncbi:MAG: glycosyltransferase family 4 protein [Candidatus Margulisbacteria bacterium]|jgi:glycosyltransferase involved in cell wall biosynthesis|nr:glycosyltransferase family 4 protein [Candidatus Margulisiibacteriota bacterium]